MGVQRGSWKLEESNHHYDLQEEGSRNYRQVSFNSTCGKILQQLILETISRHMKDKKMIRNSQHAFMMGKLCLTNLISFYHVVTVLVDERRPVDTVYLDFSKAFHTICHNMLTEKLCQISEHWDGLKTGWTARVIRFVINSTTSSWRTVTRVMPQSVDIVSNIV